MMNYQTIERLVDDKLSLSGLSNEGKEQQVKVLLHHLYSAYNMWRQMTPDEKNEVILWHLIFKDDYPLNKFLKELKRKKTKETNSPTPPKESKKRKRKIAENTHTPRTREDLEQDLRKRRDEFWAELRPFIGEYSRGTVERFYMHWAEDIKDECKMRKDYERGFRVAYRLKKWSMTSFNANDEIADIRLAKAKASKKKETKADEQQVAIARERMMEQERLEQERQQAKANACSHEEWLAMKAAQEE